MANCKLGDLFVSIEDVPDEHTALHNATWNQDEHGNYIWSAKNLSRAIGNTEYSIGATTIKDHRNFVCGCNK